MVSQHILDHAHTVTGAITGTVPLSSHSLHYSLAYTQYVASHIQEFNPLDLSRENLNLSLRLLFAYRRGVLASLTAAAASTG